VSFPDVENYGTIELEVLMGFNGGKNNNFLLLGLFYQANERTSLARNCMEANMATWKQLRPCSSSRFPVLALVMVSASKLR